MSTVKHAGLLYCIKAGIAGGSDFLAIDDVLLASAGFGMLVLPGMPTQTCTSPEL